MDNTVNITPETEVPTPTQVQAPTSTQKPKREARTVQQQLQDLEAKEKELQQKKKRLKAKLSSDERKQRTKRLIETGAMTEKVFGEVNMDTLLTTKRLAAIGLIVKQILDRDICDTDLQKFFNFLDLQEKRGRFFSNAMK